MVVGMAEFLEKVAKQKRTQDKIDMLKANDTFALRVILQAVYDPKVKFLLPDGDPPFKPNVLVDQQNVFHKDARMIQYFVEGFHPDLAQARREAMFIEFLEKLDPKDAQLLLLAKAKKPIKGITLQHVTEALPGLI
ncbi:MAG: hypothetical protein [Caudoviricetes sp.]|nr:MAG: hypothetical protein [Caudoviricetes sp.]